jgi:hypothetical protein
MFRVLPRPTSLRNAASKRSCGDCTSSIADSERTHPLASAPALGDTACPLHAVPVRWSKTTAESVAVISSCRGHRCALCRLPCVLTACSPRLELVHWIDARRPRLGGLDLDHVSLHLSEPQQFPAGHGLSETGFPESLAEKRASVRE